MNPPNEATKKSMPYFLLLGVCLLWTGLAHAEVVPVYISISGDISNQFDDSPSADTHYVYIIKGKSWVPSGNDLTVPPGVEIRLECTFPIDVYGGFVATGVDSTGIKPIEIRAIASAEGFLFWGAREDTVLLDHVYFSEDSFPRTAFTSIGRTLKATACEIRAQWAAIQCFDAPAEITDCQLFKMGGGGAALTLRAADESCVERTSVKVDFSHMLPDFPTTAGIHVSSSPVSRITDNTIEVNGQGYTAGIYGENRCSDLTVDGVTISVRSDNLLSRGIWLVNAGHCDILACTVGVESRSSVQAALWLYGWTLADLVNCDLRLEGHGQGELIHQEGGATATVDGIPAQPDLRRPEPNHRKRSDEIWVGTAFPNPFNLATTLPLELPASASAEIRITDLLGREVARVAYGTLLAGRHSLPLSADTWASGSYFAHVGVNGKFVETQRLILIK